MVHESDKDWFKEIIDDKLIYCFDGKNVQFTSVYTSVCIHLSRFIHLLYIAMRSNIYIFYRLYIDYIDRIDI